MWRLVLLTLLLVVWDLCCPMVVRWLQRRSQCGRAPRGPWRPWRATVGFAGLYILGTWAFQGIIYARAAMSLRAVGLALAVYGLAQLRTTWQEATREVSLDFTLSLLVNLVGQRLIYGALASAEMMTTFTAVFLPLVYLRRLATRLLFSTVWPAGHYQPRWHTALEVVSDTLLAMLMAYGLQVLWYGAAATLARAGSLTVALYAFTLLRRYMLRRLFEAWRRRQETGTPPS